MIKTILIVSCILMSTFLFSQEGKNLDLYATLELFKEAESVEDFESSLNSEKNSVNNLDLNNDGFVDYIRVIEYKEAEFHTLTLQVPLSESTAQDVAVIEIEQNGENTSVQIVGDSELYGENQIIEPNSVNESTAQNVSNWKAVNHMYSPKYKIWVSPWRYNHHPKSYRAWKPLSFTIYSGKVKRHRSNYRRVSFHRSHKAYAHHSKHRSHNSKQHKSSHKKHHRKHH